jgi:hypothetical protein
MAGPVFGEETILYADCDFDLIKAAKVQIDSMGHYQRWDIANIQFNMKETEPFTVDIRSVEDAAASMTGKQKEAEKDDSIEK